MIKVWTDAAEAGLLDRHGWRGSTFAYLPGAPPAREVSVTMPLRLESWSVPFGLLPVFEMNLPEGALRERLRLAFAKATGTFDEFDLLSIVGRSQIGRIRYTGDKEHLHEDVPFQSVDEILERRRGGDLFRYSPAKDKLTLLGKNFLTGEYVTVCDLSPDERYVYYLPGAHGSAGVQWDPIRHFGVFVDAGVAAFPSPPAGYQKVVFVPSIGVEPRL